MSRPLNKALKKTRPCSLHTTLSLRPRRPFVTLRDDTHPLLHPPRSHPFSTSPPCLAGNVIRAAKSAKKNSGPSLRLAMQRQQEAALRSGDIPNDMGLLPDTVIMPMGKNRPSWFANRKGRLRLERKRWYARYTDFKAVFGYKYFSIRPVPKLRPRALPGIARDLHSEMYTHFASGNLSPLESRLCDGLLASLTMRARQRPANTRMSWTLEKYITKPKLMSYKAALLPDKNRSQREANGVVQAVVRIHSLQSLQHLKRIIIRGDDGRTSTREVPCDSQGRELDRSGGTPNAKESLEYVVIQRQVKKGEEGPWMIWGMAEETTLEKLDREERKKAQVGAGAGEEAAVEV